MHKPDLISTTNTRCKDKLTVLQLRHWLTDISTYSQKARKNPKHSRVILAFTDSKWKTCQKCLHQARDFGGVEKRGKVRVTEGQSWALCALFLSVSREGSNQATWEKTSVLGVLERLRCDRISCSGRIMKAGKCSWGGCLHKHPVRGPLVEHSVSNKYGHGWETSLIWEMREIRQRWGSKLPRSVILGVILGIIGQTFQTFLLFYQQCSQRKGTWVYGRCLSLGRLL